MEDGRVIDFWSSCCQGFTSNRPCLLVRVLPSMVQKLMWDFPQVTIRLASMGWNTAANTESLEHCRDRRHQELIHLVFVILQSFCLRSKVQGTLTSASCFSFCQFQTDRMWSLASSTAQRNVPPFWQGNKRVRQLQIFINRLNSETLQDVSLLTDLEKVTQVTALSNTPIPITWSVLRLTESQTRTWGASSWTDRWQRWNQTETVC